jgi:acyl dehydratase
MKFSEVRIDQEYSASFTISDEMVRTFAEITGDKNPVYLDEEKQRLILQTNVIKSDGTVAIEGQAEVLIEQ